MILEIKVFFKPLPLLVLLCTLLFACPGISSAWNNTESINNFLLKQSPDLDVLNSPKKLLENHAHIAAYVADNAPWSLERDSGIFSNYVLPLRLRFESLEDWRVPLFQELWPQVQNCAQALDAAKIIQQWLNGRVRPAPASAIARGPMALLASGSGRCEELSMLFVAACRSVGIAARMVYVPAWADMNDNHAWAEVWQGNAWHAISVEQAEAHPGEAWFLPHVEKVPLVIAEVLGKPLPHEQGDVLVQQAGSYSLNVTANYAATGTVRISVQSEEGFDPSQAILQVHMFNGGQARAVLSASGPSATWKIGTGTWLVSAAVNKEGKFFSAYQVLTVEKDQDIQLTLQPALGINLVQEEIWQSRGNSPRGTHPTPGGQGGPATQALADLKLPLLDLKNLLPLSDCPYATLADLGYEEKLVQQALAFWEGQGQGVPENIALEFVQPGRIAYEAFSHWRADYFTYFSHLLSPGMHTRQVAQAINVWASKLPIFEVRIKQAPGLTPKQVLQMQRADSATSVRNAVVAGLRALGIPARLTSLKNMFFSAVEYWDAGQWWPLYYDQPQELGNKDITAASKSYYSQTVFWNFHELQETLADSHYLFHAADYGQLWTLCRISPAGRFIPLSQDFVHDQGIEVVAGLYVLVFGKNTEAGMVWRVREMKVEAHPAENKE